MIANNSLYFCASNIMKIFTELGRLCGHESRSGNLHDVGFRRASDLLVGNSADTTCKGKGSIKYFL